MKGFARMTKLGNIGGRGKYITDVRKQEEILAKSEAVDWTPYHVYEQFNQRTDKANWEGRELVVALPNAWAKLPPDELAARAQKLAEVAAGKKTDMQWAVHWNHSRSNLHIHVIFSERTRTKEAGVYDRDVYLTYEGKVARRKADRAQGWPPIHRKGESKGEFTAKDKRYKSRSWLREVKAALVEQLRAYGVEIVPPDPFHEYHEGKGRNAPEIREKNEVVREQNRLFKEYRQRFPEVSESIMRRVMLADIRKGKVTHVYRDKGGQVMQAGLKLKDYRAAVAQDNLAAAYRDVWRQRYYLLDRRPASPDSKGLAALALPGQLRPQVDTMKQAYADYRAALERKAGMGFFDRKGKAEQDRAMDAATARYEAAAAVLAPYTETPGYVPSIHDHEQYIKAAEKALNNAEWKADDVRRGLRPEGLPEGSPEAFQKAVERFKAACADIPADGREMAVERLKRECTGMSGPDMSITLQTRLAVEDVRRQALPSRQEQLVAQQQLTRPRHRDTGRDR